MILEYETWVDGINVSYAVLCSACEQSARGVRLLRVWGQTADVVIPEDIGGLRPEIIGEYCFAEKFGSCGTGEVVSEDLEKIEEIAARKGLTALAGKYIKSVVLPNSVHTLENYAFYNCGNMSRLEFGAKLNTVDNGAFMNCRSLDILAVRGSVSEPSGAQYFLARLNKGVELTFLDRDSKKVTGSFYYSEYTESYEEIGPAHIFQLDVSGEGYRARQLFNSGVIDINSYDGIFVAAAALENAYTLSKTAVGRIMYPVEMSEKFNNIYRDYITAHIEETLDWIVGEKRTDIIKTMGDAGLLDEKGLAAALDKTSKAGWTQGSAAIIETSGRIASGIKKSRYML